VLKCVESDCELLNIRSSSLKCFGIVGMHRMIKLQILFQDIMITQLRALSSYLLKLEKSKVAHGYHNLIDIFPEVQNGIDKKAPMVALESTIITHGMPYPKNVEMARNVENIIRDQVRLLTPSPSLTLVLFSFVCPVFIFVRDVLNENPSLSMFSGGCSSHYCFTKWKNKSWFK